MIPCFSCHALWSGHRSATLIGIAIMRDIQLIPVPPWLGVAAGILQRKLLSSAEIIALPLVALLKLIWCFVYKHNQRLVTLWYGIQACQFKRRLELKSCSHNQDQVGYPQHFYVALANLKSNITLLKKFVSESVWLCRVRWHVQHWQFQSE